MGDARFDGRTQAAPLPLRVAVLLVESVEGEAAADEDVHDDFFSLLLLLIITDVDDLLDDDDSAEDDERCCCCFKEYPRRQLLNEVVALVALNMLVSTLDMCVCKKTRARVDVCKIKIY